MKKTISVICILIFIFCINSFPAFTAAKECKDPYNTIYASDYDECIITSSVGKTDFKEKNGYVGGMRKGDYLVYKDVDFSRQPSSVMLHLGRGPEYNAKIEIRLDSVDGTVLVSADVASSDWENGISQTELITTKVSGIHDLYFTWTLSSCHFFEMIFYSDQLDANEDPPYITYQDTFRYNDIKDNRFCNEILTADSLGLITSYSTEEFKPSMPVTRQEFAKSVYEIMDMQPVSDSKYSDVSSSTVNFEMIGALKERGYMKGKTDDKFEPLSFLSVFDAAVVAVRMLGFEHMAELKGGYPTGYRIVANDLGIFDGLKDEDVMRRDSLSKWIVNVINADYTTVSAIENNSIEYENKVGILSNTKKIFIGNGVVTANRYTSIYTPEGQTGKNYVEINGELFFCQNIYADSYIGMKCTYYYKNINNRKEIISIVPQKNVTLKILTAKKIKEFNTSKISYCNNDSDKLYVLKTSPSTAFIINAKAVNNEITDIVLPKDIRGEILWIDNNSDGIAEVVKASIPQTYKIRSINDNKIINDIDGSECLLGDSDYIIMQGNKKIKGVDLPTNSIVSVFESKNTVGKKFVRIVLIENIVKANVTEVNNDGICIGDEFYKSNIEVNVNCYGEFYINEFGYVVYYDGMLSDNDYIGLFLGYSQENSSIDSDSIKLKIYESNGIINIYSTEKSINADGIKFNDCDSLINGNEHYIGLNCLKLHTPIRYRLSKNGCINFLDTVLSGSLDENDTMKSLVSSKPEIYYRTGLQIFTENGRMKYPVSHEGYLFSYYSYADCKNAENYMVKELSQLKANEAVQAAEIYSSKGENVGDIVVDSQRIPKYTWSMNMFVTDVSNVADKNGEITKKIYGIVDNKNQSFCVNYSAYVNNFIFENGSPLKTLSDSLKKGDILKYILNADNEIVAAKLIFTDGGAYKNCGGVTATLYNDGSNICCYWGQNDMANLNVLGTVEEKVNGYIKLKLFDGSTEYILTEGQPIIKFDSSEQTFKPKLSSVEMETGDTVVVGMTSMTVNQIAVFGKN